jgi:hypothetical protein|tara:strand:- start:2021 stop:2167 length:147 start_codon:yes stop_codon:yes gene_type:complete
MGWVVKSSVAAQRRIIKFKEEKEDFKLDEFLLTEAGRREFNYCYLEQR